MSRSNYDKPFYVDIGTSMVAIRCASNHDVLMRYDYSLRPNSLNFAKGMCNRMNREVEIGKPLRNCDVGTVEQQRERFRKFCFQRLCKNCPMCSEESYSECGLMWMQAHYDEEK